MITLFVDREVIRCKRCHRTVTFFYLSDFTYGERLVSYDQGKYFYFNFFNDEVHDKFRKTVEKMGRELEIPLNAAQIHRIFGITIDPIDGRSIDIEAYDERCPYCGSEHYEDVIAEPRETASLEVPVVSHEHWHMLSDAQKQERLRAAIEALK